MTSTAIEYAPSSIWLPNLFKKIVISTALQFNRDSGPWDSAAYVRKFFRILLKSVPY